MNMLLLVVSTLAAGAIGTVLRFTIVRVAPVAGVHAVNVVGTVVLAAVVAQLNVGAIAWQVAVIIGVGFAGTFTTFSAWIVLIERRMHTHPWRTVLIDVVAPVGVSVALTVVTFVIAG